MVTDKPKKKEDFELPESQKYKLTLGIDREVVRRAKIEDINISFWTEQLLKIMTFKPEEIRTSHEDVVETWYTFLLEIKKVLEKYGIPEVVLGQIDLYEKGKKPNTVGGITGYLQFIFNVDGYLYDREFDIKGQQISFEEEQRRLKEEGLTYVSPPSKLNKDIIKDYWPSGIFRNPIKIIENLLYQMTQSSKINKAKVKEMQVALRVLKLLSENSVNNNNTG